VSVLALVIAGAALIASYGAWRRTAHEHTGRHHRVWEVGEGRTRFMALAGTIVTAVFAINIVLNGLAVFLVGPCT
jgi:hypothetical protein